MSKTISLTIEDHVFLLSAKGVGEFVAGMGSQNMTNKFAKQVIKTPLHDLDTLCLSHTQFYDTARHHEQLVMDIMHTLGCRPMETKCNGDSPVTSRQVFIHATDVQLVRDGVVYLFNGVQVPLHPKTRIVCYGDASQRRGIVMPKAWVNRTARYHNESDTVLD